MTEDQNTGIEIDWKSVEAPEMGRALTGLGLNLLVRDMKAEVAFLVSVFQMVDIRSTQDFALVGYGKSVIQIHGDHTYHSNPLPSLLPEVGARGAGAELRLYESDPEEACARAEEGGYMVLQPPTDKPHGLREAFILSPDGYCWVPSRPLEA